MGNNDFQTAATTRTAHQRREKRTDPLIESPHAGFNLNDLTEFAVWTLEQRGVDFSTALLGRTITLYNFATGSRCKNAEMLEFEYLATTDMTAKTLQTLAPAAGLDIITDKSKINQIGCRHTTTITHNRDVRICALASLSILECLRFMPSDKSGWGHSYFNFTNIDAYFGVPVITDPDQHDSRPTYT